MCSECGCNQIESAPFRMVPKAQFHSELEHEFELEFEHERSQFPHTFEIRKGLLSKNERAARRNREGFQSHHLLVLNLLSSPGSGKTLLIEETAKRWPTRSGQVGVIVGDLATDNDARRLRLAGATAIQITTGSACHLEAEMVAHALSHLTLATLDLLVIENVGNLICPASYDLGETLRIVLLSVTEGEDKPLKYPTAFQSADVVVLTKTDIAEAVGFERETAIANIRRMAPQAQLFEVSARRGDGMDTWLTFLQTQQKLVRNKEGNPQ